MRWYLELVSRNTADDNITERETLLYSPPVHGLNFMLLLLKPGASAELLDVIDIDTVHFGAVVGEQSCQWPADDFAPVNDGNAPAMESSAVVQDCVIDVEVLKNLDDGQRRAWQDGLACVVWRIEEADVLVHVTDELGRQAFYILEHADGPLESPVTHGVKDGIVDDHTVHFSIGVGISKFILKVLAIDLT